MTPVMIGGFVVVLIILAVVAAYFMGFFGDEKVPASSSNDSSNESSTSTPAASTSAASTSAASTSAASTSAASTSAASTSAASTPAASTTGLGCVDGQVESNGECLQGITINFIMGNNKIMIPKSEIPDNDFTSLVGSYFIDDAGDAIVVTHLYDDEQIVSEIPSVLYNVTDTTNLTQNNIYAFDLETPRWTQPPN